jgi:transcriptional regulator with XRE-family HTH domain
MKSDLLREQRIQHGWSQTRLAKELGVDARTVRRWELGKTVPVPYYRKRLVSLFGKTAQELGLCSDSDENERVEEAPTPINQLFEPDVPNDVEESPSDSDENERVEEAPTPINQLLEPDVPDDVEKSPAVVQTNSSYWQDEYKRPLLMNDIDGDDLLILGAKYSRSRLLKLMLFLSVIIILISFAFLPAEILIRNIWKAPAVTNTPTPTPVTNSTETEVKPQVYNKCNGPDWQSHTDSSYGQYYTVKTNGSSLCYQATWNISNNIAAAKSCDFRAFIYPGNTANVKYHFFTNHRGSVYVNISQATPGWLYFSNYIDINFIELGVDDTQSGTIIGVGPFFIYNCHSY